MRIGAHVSFVDEYAVAHHAICTQVWDAGDPEKYPTPAINLLFVSDDESQTDQYGRQIVRKTSVVHHSQQSAHGFYYLELDPLSIADMEQRGYLPREVPSV